MTILRIEHKVPGYDGWKQAFDSDPINRRQLGVRRYRIIRPVDDPNYVVVDLEFNNQKNAETTLEALQKLWRNIEGKVIFTAQTRIFDVVETVEV
jgi:hypothetical protein